MTYFVNLCLMPKNAHYSRQNFTRGLRFRVLYEGRYNYLWSNKMKKLCLRCNNWKDVTKFEDRKDAWSQYSWCNKCRRFEKRDLIPDDQKEYMEKTDVFILK